MEALAQAARVEEVLEPRGEIEMAEFLPDALVAHEAREETRDGLGYRVLVLREDVRVRQLYAEGAAEEGGDGEPVGEGAHEGSVEEGREEALQAEALEEDDAPEGDPGLEGDEEEAREGPEEEVGSDTVSGRAHGRLSSLPRERGEAIPAR